MPFKKSDEGAHKELSGLTEPVALSAQLAAIVGVEKDKKLRRKPRTNLEFSSFFACVFAPACFSKTVPVQCALLLFDTYLSIPQYTGN